jgi:hypothetical protein
MAEKIEFPEKRRRLKVLQLIGGDPIGTSKLAELLGWYRMKLHRACRVSEPLWDEWRKLPTKAERKRFREGNPEMMPEPLFTPNGERYWFWRTPLKKWVNDNATQIKYSPKKQSRNLLREEAKHRKKAKEPTAEKQKGEASKVEQPLFMAGLDKGGEFLNFIDKKLPLCDWPKGGIEQLREDLEPFAKALWPKPPWASE